MPDGAEFNYPPGLAQDWLAQHLFTRLDPGGPLFWLALVLAVVLFGALLAAMQKLGSGPRRRLTAACTFIAGLFYLFAFFLPPGNTASGTLEGLGEPRPFSGSITWVRPAPPESTAGEPAPEAAPPAPPGPAERRLSGEVKLADPPEGGEPLPGEHVLPIQGVQQADGTWRLEAVGPAGPQPLTATAGGYAVTVGGRPATLRLAVQPALNRVKAYETPLGQFLLVLGGFAIGLGLINLVHVHGRVVLRGLRGWHNSLAFFAGLLGMAIFGIWQMYLPETEPGAAMPWPRAAYSILFDGLLKPLQSTTFALLGFFIVSAAYRAFRIRNTEAALMTIVAFIVMMGQVPIGQALTAWIDPAGPLAFVRVENITNWLLTNPNAAATRGILFGAVTGGFALSLRVWLSLERGTYFGKDF